MGKFNDYNLNTSLLGQLHSLHGFKYLSDNVEERHWKKLFRRTFWCGFILLSISLMVQVLSLSWNEFSSKATSINLDVNYRDWNNSFPAVSICLMKGRSTDGIRDFLLDYWNATNFPTPNRPIRHYRNVQNLLFMTFHQPLDGIDVKRCLELNSTCGVNIEIVRKELLPKSCRDFMPLVKFLGREIKCEEIFKPHRSEIGNCFTANSLFSYGNSLENFDQLPLKFSNQEDSERSLELHYTENELVILKLFVHSPDELPDGITEGFNLRKSFASSRFTSSHTYMAFKIIEMINQGGVKNESRSGRHCRFPDEIITDSKHFMPPYSLANCRAAFRVTRELNNCNCTLPVGDGAKYLPPGLSICYIEQFKCIQNSYEHFVNLGEEREDYCSTPTCTSMEISMVGQVETTIEEKNSVIVIDVLNKPTLRYVRRVVTTKLDMLGN